MMRVFLSPAAFPVKSSGQVLENSRQVDGGSSTDTLGILGQVSYLAQVTLLAGSIFARVPHISHQLSAADEKERE